MQWIEVSLGKKQQKREKFNWKETKHGKNMEKPKHQLAAYVSADSMDPFFSVIFCLETELAVVGLDVSVSYSFLSPCSFHPPCGLVPMKDESFFHPSVLE